MRLCLTIPFFLVGCATTHPPELRDPLAHIRPVEVNSSVAEAPETATALDSPQDCETQRLTAFGGDPKALRAFANCAITEGEFVRAFHALDGMDVPERITAGLLSGKLTASEENLNTALELTPDSSALWNLLGAEYENQGRDAEAVDAYLRAKSLS